MTEVIARLTAALSRSYRLLRELGAGGMATVYLAHDLKHDRQVAIKVLRPELAAVIGAERFLSEIKTTANLQHPNILPLFDSGAADSYLFYVMPFIEGESLGERLVRQKTLPLAEALRITREVADALRYAHSRGIIHRDLKPGNILLANGHALVADFGIARPMDVARIDRLTETGLVVGTPGYMSPEQAAGDRTLDGRSDLFALGCLLYEMLTGQSPFGGPTAQARMTRTFTGQYTPAGSVRPEAAIVDPLLARLLATDTDARPRDAGLVIEALDTLIAPAAGVLDAAPPSAPIVGSTRRRAVLAAGIGLLILAGGLYLRGRTAPPATSIGLAIVPFEALNATARDSALAGALLPGLATRLTLLPGVEIAASHAIGGRGSDSAAADLTRYALRVGARYILAGTLHWDEVGAGIARLQPRLFEIVAGSAPIPVWSDSFSVAPAELFQAEIRIARGVGAALRRTPRGENATRIDAAPTRSPAAYLEYLYGTMPLGEDSTGPQTRLERAVGLDSSFTLAWAALAAICAVDYRTMQSAVSRACARRGAERAMALDSNLADSRLAAGLYARLVLADFPMARRHLERATALAPWDAKNSMMLVAVLMSLGEWDQARMPASRAEALEPQDVQGILRVADIAISQHQYAEGNAALDRASSLDSVASLPIYYRALALVQQGDLAGAQRYLEQAPVRGPRLAAIASRGVRYGRVWFYPPDSREELLAAPVQLFDGHQARQLLAVAQIHWLAGRTERSRESAVAAIPWARQDVAASPENDDEGMRLAFALALAGRRDEAIKEGSRSSALRPVSRDARNGPFTQLTYAEVLAVAGARDSAVAVLTALIGRPGPATPGWIATDPFLAPLAGMPAFDALTGRVKVRPS